MGSIVRNKDVEKCLRELLNKKEGETIYIEVIGHKSAGPARARDFYESFFRAISRLNRLGRMA